MTEDIGGKASFLYSRWAHGDQLVATHASFAYAQGANPGADRKRNCNGMLWVRRMEGLVACHASRRLTVIARARLYNSRTK